MRLELPPGIEQMKHATRYTPVVSSSPLDSLEKNSRRPRFSAACWRFLCTPSLMRLLNEVPLLAAEVRQGVDIGLHGKDCAIHIALILGPIRQAKEWGLVGPVDRKVRQCGSRLRADGDGGGHRCAWIRQVRAECIQAHRYTCGRVDPEGLGKIDLRRSATRACRGAVYEGNEIGNGGVRLILRGEHQGWN